MTTLTMRYMRAISWRPRRILSRSCSRRAVKQGTGVPNIIPVHRSGKSAPIRPSERATKPKARNWCESGNERRRLKLSCRSGWVQNHGPKQHRDLLE